MDGVTLDAFAKAFKLDGDKKPNWWGFYGKVESIDGDTGYYNVVSGYNYDWDTQVATTQTTSCAPFCKAAVGDVVLVAVINGNPAAIGRDGGDCDVSGVKGDLESAYRTGDVNITAANVGALPTSGGEMTGTIEFSGTEALPHSTTVAGSPNYYPIVMNDTFANDGKLSYMTTSEFRQLYACKLLFSGTAATSVTISETAGNFEYLVVEIALNSSKNRYATVAAMAGHYTNWMAPVLSSSVWYVKGGYVYPSGTTVKLGELKNFGVGTGTALQNGLQTESGCVITRVWGVR